MRSYEVLLRALEGYSKDTPEEASQEHGASRPRVKSTAGSSGVVPATSAGEPAAQIQGRLHENADNLLEEEKSSQGVEDSSSGTGPPSSETGTLPQGAGNSSPGNTPSIHPGTQLLLRPGSNLPLRFGSHRMHRITRPPVRDPFLASKKFRIFRQHARQESIGGRPPRPRILTSRFWTHLRRNWRTSERGSGAHYKRTPTWKASLESAMVQSNQGGGGITYTRGLTRVVFTRCKPLAVHLPLFLCVREAGTWVGCSVLCLRCGMNGCHCCCKHFLFLVN